MQAAVEFDVRPYQRLAAAVLRQALEDVRGSDEQRRRDARDWLRDRQRSLPYCDLLDVDHEAMVETLQREGVMR